MRDISDSSAGENMPLRKRSPLQPGNPPGTSFEFFLELDSPWSPCRLSGSHCECNPHYFVTHLFWLRCRPQTPSSYDVPTFGIFSQFLSVHLAHREEVLFWTCAENTLLGMIFAQISCLLWSCRQHRPVCICLKAQLPKGILFTFPNGPFKVA